MIQCFDKAYYVTDGGKGYVPADQHPEWDAQAAHKNTITHQIISAHNTSGSEETSACI